MATHPAHIEAWDDERSLGNGVIVTLAWGWSFARGEHEGVRGFDTVGEARQATARKRLHPCRCAECQDHTRDPEAPGRLATALLGGLEG